MLPILNAAMVFAEKAHQGQVRKYTNEPYICHPMAVMGLVYSITNIEDMLCVAVLHDVVEETDYTIENICDRFGLSISNMVFDLTDISKPEDGNRGIRKAIDRLHTQEASKEAKTIKLADLIDNTKSIIFFDPNFARVYIHEKKRLLGVLTEGNPILYKIATGLVNKYYETNPKI